MIANFFDINFNNIENFKTIPFFIYLMKNPNLLIKLQHLMKFNTINIIINLAKNFYTIFFVSNAHYY